MSELKTQTISFRVPLELKNEFLELFNGSEIKSKPEFFKEILKKYQTEGSLKIEPEELSEKEESIDNNIEVIEKNENIINENTDDVEAVEKDNSIIDENTDESIINDPVNKTKIVIELNSVQDFALRETILNDGFIDEVNKIVDKVNNAKDTSFFGDSSYSGSFKGVFTEMLQDNEGENTTKNMGIALVNNFMSYFMFGPGDLHTPITKSILKEFIQSDNSVDLSE